MTTLPNKWKSKFFTITIGQAISLIGSSAVQFALIWWLASHTDSPIIMAISGLIAFLPQMILGPFVGVWIDRLKRKWVIIIADMMMGVGALIFAFFFIWSEPPYWSAFLILAVRGIGGVFHTPAIQSVIPLLVPNDELVRANGWSQFLQSGAFMLGPVLGAAMYAMLPMWLILMSDFIGATVACITVAIVKIPELVKPENEQKHFARELKEGALIFLKDKKLLAMTLTAMCCMIFFLPLSSYYPLMTSGYFKLSAWHASAVELTYALGMMLASFAFGIFGHIKRKFLVVHLGLLGVGISSLLCGFLPPNMSGFWIFSVICAVMGASGNIYGVPFMAYMQENIPHEAQGRAFSLIGSLMSAAMPIGLLISGPVAERFGVPFWFGVTGLACIVFVIIDMILIKKL